ncbi:glycosyl hydrolase family 18 protein [Paenibacillus gansuensis]|uniref:Glycosyl hydrolase family 18 protein n=1 Tax=Paenibacillus gansuensis TaxID=306542 RepID=A0ABW5PIM0_9BACL
MRKSIPFCLSLTLFILLLTYMASPAPAVAAGYSFQTGVVTASAAEVYAEAYQDSAVISRMAQGAEYPVLGFSAGDTLRSIHTVKPKETLYVIAQSYQVTVSSLKQWNHLAGDNITVGQKLSIPDTYVQLQLLGGRKGWVRHSKLRFKKQSALIFGWNFGTNAATLIRQSSRPNLNVVSPRWFVINSGPSVVTINENAGYVQAMHNRGKRVWPLLGNRFDATLTYTVLSDAAKRHKLVIKLRDSLIRTGADGVNVDFENIDLRNRQDFVNFIKELKAALAPKGKIVSVDVTRTNPDPNWSGSFDRAALGRAADYLIMMGYEEHWGGSSHPGPVASLPWVRGGITELMKDVPSHKIILGIPFYTRQWVTDQATGKVTSTDLTMQGAVNRIKSNHAQIQWDPAASQRYAAYTVNGKLHQLWLEDELSTRLRYDLVKQYRLKGVAAWYVGAETPDIWRLF